MLFYVDDEGNFLDHWALPDLQYYQGKEIDLTLEGALELIDQVLIDHGVDPARVKDSYGWRHLEFGEVQGAVGVSEWQDDEYNLIVFVPLLRLPEQAVKLTDFYQTLLHLNHHGTLAARFSIRDNIVFVGLTRSIRGLDAEEVEDAINAVLVVADGYARWLAGALAFEIGDIPVSLSKLPNVPMKPKQAQLLSIVMSACDEHGRDIIVEFLEGWHRAGFIFDVTSSGIGLKILVSNKEYGLAGVRPGIGGAQQLIILGWESIRRSRVFSDKAIDAYQRSVLGLAKLKITESSAHIKVDSSFGIEETRELIKAMKKMAVEAREPEPLPVYEWPADILQPKIDVGSKTLAKIGETLQACDRWTQEIFIMLMENWRKSDGRIHCQRSGRIYLRLTTAEHDFGDYGRRRHTFNLAVLAAPRKNRGPTIDLAWNLASGEYQYLDYAAAAVAQFEQAVVALPGYIQQGTIHRLILDKSFKKEDTSRLLESLLALKSAATSPSG